MWLRGRKICQVFEKNHSNYNLKENRGVQFSVIFVRLNITKNDQYPYNDTTLNGSINFVHKLFKFIYKTEPYVTKIHAVQSRSAMVRLRCWVTSIYFELGRFLTYDQTRDFVTFANMLLKTPAMLIYIAPCATRTVCSGLIFEQ